jgi:hypothetical protein
MYKKDVLQQGLSDFVARNRCRWLEIVGEIGARLSRTIHVLKTEFLEGLSPFHLPPPPSAEWDISRYEM